MYKKTTLIKQHEKTENYLVWKDGNDDPSYLIQYERRFSNSKKKHTSQNNILWRLEQHNGNKIKYSYEYERLHLSSSVDSIYDDVIECKRGGKHGKRLSL